MSAFSYHFNASLPFSAKEATMPNKEKVRFIYTSDLKGMYKILNESGIVAMEYSPFTFFDWEGKPHVSCECKIQDLLTGYSVVGFGEVCPETLNSDISRNYLLCQCRDIAFSKAMIDFLDIGGTKVLSSSEIHVDKENITNKDTALAKPADWSAAIKSYKLSIKGTEQ